MPPDPDLQSSNARELGLVQILLLRHEVVPFLLAFYHVELDLHELRCCQRHLLCLPRWLWRIGL